MCSKPVILHTDIGSDIDDFWALVMLLRQSDKLDLKMILTDTWNSVARAAICEKILEGTPFADRVLIGAGVLDNNRNYSHEQWVAGYDMSQYPGAFRKDGVTAMIELVRSAEEPIRSFPSVRQLLWLRHWTAHRILPENYIGRHVRQHSPEI